MARRVETRREMLSTPPANEAPLLKQHWEQAQPSMDFDYDKLYVRGYDWQTIPKNIARLYTLPEPYNLKRPITISLTNFSKQIDYEWDMEDALSAYLGYARGNAIELNAYQTPDQANSTLWHEIQHVYQFQENRWVEENYTPPPFEGVVNQWSTPANKDDYQESYYDHPNEIDANAFAEIMNSLPLVEAAPVYINPNDTEHWFPNRFHLDSGEWDDEAEEYRIEPSKAYEIVRGYVGR